MTTMAETCPRLAEKMRNLMALNDLSQAEIARRATKLGGDKDDDVTPQALNRYVKDGAAPRPDVARRIARVLGVEVEWFIDESKPWSDDYPRYGVVGWDQIDDLALIREVGRRYRSDILEIVEALDVAEQTDTQKVAERLFANGLSDLPDDFDRRLDIAASALTLLDLAKSKYDPDVIAWNQHEHLPGAARSADELLFHGIADRIERINRQNPGLLWIDRYSQLRVVANSRPDRRSLFLEYIPRFLQLIKDGKAPDPLDAPSLIAARHFNPGSGQEKVWGERASHLKKQMEDQGYKF